MNCGRAGVRIVPARPHRQWHNRLRIEEAIVAGFQTTRWSLILKAAEGDSAEATLALALLCEAYWYPVYAFVRRQGHAPPDAEDLTQSYFARFLEKDVVRGVRPESGRFRSFLVVSVRNFLHNERDRERALKRGGGRRLVSLDVVTAEREYEREPADAATPESLFERSWARTVFDHVVERLEQETARHEGAERVARLRPFLTGVEPRDSYADIASEWGVGESAVRVAVHRLRKRFAALLRDEVGRTVSDEKDVDDEIRYILSLVP
jgi:RNA polymerase sigma-70 factor (ECF subfamily)